MKTKRYEIKTIKEIIELINETNINNFIVDFTNWLHLRVYVNNLPRNRFKNNDTFVWIDDDKNEININFKLEKVEK
jgi:hypothetical protein